MLADLGSLGLKRVLRFFLRRGARAARAVFRAVWRILPRRQRLPAVIDPYLGYSTQHDLIARGRLLTALRGRDPRPQQGRLVNLWQMLSLFQTDEVAGVTVAVGDVTAVSDDEGYFSLHLPRSVGDGQQAAGWIALEATADGQITALPVQVTRVDAEFAVISDIDDTMIYTGAWQLWRNLWNSLTGNALTRQVFPDAVVLMDALSAGGRNPVFYVSSSPWNFHAFLEAVMARSALVRGPLFLRDLGVGTFLGGDNGHHGHKGDVIDRVLNANPDLMFVLLGDTGQHDAEIYRAAAMRHPGRVARVVLRRAGRAAPEADVAGLRAQGVAVDVVEDYGGIAAQILAGRALPRLPVGAG